MLFSIKHHYLIVLSGIVLMVRFGTSVNCALPSATNFNGLPLNKISKHIFHVFSHVFQRKGKIFCTFGLCINSVYFSKNK